MYGFTYPKDTKDIFLEQFRLDRDYAAHATEALQK